MRASIPFLVTALLSSSCGAKGPASASLWQGIVKSAEDGSPDGIDENILHEHTEKVVLQSSEQKDASSSSGSIFNRTVEPDEALADGELISEPIAIGGAYLSCDHSNSQAQGKTTDWTLKCKLNNADTKMAKVSAVFKKIDLKGNAFPLKVIEESLGLAWTVSDGPDTMFLNKLEALISVNDDTPVSFTSTVEKPFSITIDVAHWLASEPSNSNPGEDCVEFVNNSERNRRSIVNLTLQPPLGRFNDNECSPNKRFLCRRVDSTLQEKWRLSSDDEPYEDWALACPIGYKFSVPMNSTEMMEVASLVDTFNSSTGIWVAMNDIDTEGTFNIILK